MNKIVPPQNCRICKGKLSTFVQNGSESLYCINNNSHYRYVKTFNRLNNKHYQEYIFERFDSEDKNIWITIEYTNNKFVTILRMCDLESEFYNVKTKILSNDRYPLEKIIKKLKNINLFK